MSLIARLHHLGLVLGLALLVAFAGGACGTSGTVDPFVEGEDSDPDLWTAKSTLTAAADCEEAAAFIREALKDEVNRVALMYAAGAYGGYREDGDWSGPQAPTAGAEDNESGAPVGGEDSKDYSETTTQVQGVDESDIVKTDGDFHYALAGRDLVVLKAWPAVELAEIGRVKLPVSASSFFLLGNKKIAALSGTWFYDYNEEGEKPFDGVPPSEPTSGGAEPFPAEDQRSALQDIPFNGSGTILSVIDVADPANPVLVDVRLFEGNLMGSRRIDNVVYLALSVPPRVPYDWMWIPSVAYSQDEAERLAAMDEWADQIKAEIDAMSQEELLLHYYDGIVSADAGQGLEYGAGKALVACDSYYQPNVYSGANLMAVVAVDLTDTELSQKGAAILGSFGTVYMSPSSLYIAATNEMLWGWAYPMNVADVATTSAEGVDGNSSSSGESDTPEARASALEEEPEVETHLHGFALVGGEVTYTGSGLMDGRVLNSYAMDEHKGYLRVAATTGFAWSEESPFLNHVYVYRNVEGVLTLLAEAVHADTPEVKGFGAGEEVRGVRFLGDKGYVVTFKQTDPLFALDLSDPLSPRITGELGDLTGFSTWIGPFDEDHLLAVGQEADLDGRVIGIQVSLFDVSDMANPTLLHRKSLTGGVYSEAIGDPHALTWYPSRGKLSLPIEGWMTTDDYMYSTYDARLAIFDVDLEDGITEAGEIRHTDLINPTGGQDCAPYTYWMRLRRGVFVEDFVYAFSDFAVSSHALADPATRLASVLLNPDFSYGPIDYVGGVAEDSMPAMCIEY